MSRATRPPTATGHRACRRPAPLPRRAQLRRARAAVGACFFVNAVLYANLVPRFPEVKADLGLSNSALGAALAALPLGALLAGLSSAPLIRRFGSARVASAGLTLLAVAVWAAAAAPNWPALAGGAARGRGARRRRRRGPERPRPARPARATAGRSSTPSTASGASARSRAGCSGRPPPGLGIPLPLHLGVVALVFGLPALLGPRALLPGPDDADRADDRGHRPRARDAATRSGGPAVLAMAALGVLAACGRVRRGRRRARGARSTCATSSARPAGGGRPGLRRPVDRR